MWHSLTHYYPTPLEVLRNPWIQWSVVLPREIDDPRYDDISIDPTPKKLWVAAISSAPTAWADSR